MYVHISIPPGEVGVIQIISWGPIKNILRKRGQIYIMMIVNKKTNLFYKISTLKSESLAMAYNSINKKILFAGQKWSIFKK